MKDYLKKAFKETELLIEKVNWEDKTIYANYLAQSFYYVKYSTRLLGLAASRFELEDEALHVRFLKHAGEERSHHILALKDLERLGYSLEDFPETPATAFLYQPQFFKIMYCDPACFLGYVLALEGGAALKAPYMYERTSKVFGAQKTTFLKTHSHVDHEHVEKAFDVVDKLSESRKVEIEQNLIQSFEALKLFMIDIANFSIKTKKNAA